jgi:hypothetical protein
MKVLNNKEKPIIKNNKNCNDVMYFTTSTFFMGVAKVGKILKIRKEIEEDERQLELPFPAVLNKTEEK